LIGNNLSPLKIDEYYEICHNNTNEK